MQYRNTLHLSACAEGMFYTKTDDPRIFTNPINNSVNPYNFLSAVKQNSDFFTDSGVGGARKVR